MDVFNDVAFTLFDQPVSWGELIGDVTGVICIWWLARQIIWNWPMGLVNNVFFFILFWTSDLRANATLQVIYFVLGAYGWWQWAQGRRHPREAAATVELPVRRTAPAEWVGIAVAAAIVWPVAWWFLVEFTDPAQPALDSLTLALSVVATWGQAKKLLESWVIFIVVDAISIPLFVSQDLALTAVLYAVFGAMCAIGLRDWHRSTRAEPAAVPA